jgi:RecB family exonuclease
MFQRATTFIDTFVDELYEPEATTLGVETPFAIKIDDLKVGGVIDRIQKTATGIEIIDYKTGANGMTQKEADQSLQLSIYALAATEIYEKPFGVSPDSVDLTLIYFDPLRVIKTKRTMQQLAEARKEILEWRRLIEESDFSCSGNFFCNECEFAPYCAQSLASKKDH